MEIDAHALLFGFDRIDEVCNEIDNL